MIKCLVDAWDKNKDKLLEKISSKVQATGEYRELYSYPELVALMFDTIWNGEKDLWSYDKLKVESIAVIDDGDYQGTLILMIPFNAYQPSPCDYLMTYVYYGSCSGCDTMRAIEAESDKDQKIKDLMQLCLDILRNTIRPYGTGWRDDNNWEEIKMEKEEDI